MKFTKGKCTCKGIAPGTSTPYWEAVWQKKVLRDTKLNMSPQCALVAKKVNSLLGCTRRALPAGRGR